MSTSGPFQFGQAVWPGLAKLIEEAAEVGQVAGKLIATGGAVDHWDGTNLEERLIEEIGDVLAAATWTARRNGLWPAVRSRCEAKIAIFNTWDADKLDGPPSPEVPTND